MGEQVYDLCIIGAGFFGCAAARHASANPSLKICLIGLDEPKDDEISQREIFASHYDQGRIVKVLSHSPAYQKLSLRTIKHIKQLERLSGFKFYNPVGFMQVGKKGNYLMRYIEDTSTAIGTSFSEMLDQDFLKIKYPFLQLNKDEYGILDNSGAGIIIAREVLHAEKTVAHQQGCHILTDEVKQVEELKDNYHILQTANHGEMKAKRVLFTPGAWTNVNNFKVLPQLETYVFKELAVLVRISDTEAERLSSMPGMVYKRDGTDIGSYILPAVKYPDGSYYLKIGSMAYDSGKGLQTTEEIKDWYLSEEMPGETEFMSELLFQALPGLKSEGLVRKVCVTTETPSSFPYIDQVTPTITLACAGNGWGTCVFEEVGRLAAKLSLTGIWDSDVPKSLFEIVPKED